MMKREAISISGKRVSKHNIRYYEEQRKALGGRPFVDSGIFPLAYTHRSLVGYSSEIN